MKRFFWPAVLWSAIIFILLSIPGSDLPNETHFLNIPHSDKWVHFGIFALFVILWCRTVRFTSAKESKIIVAFILITLCGILFGYLMELVQKYLVPNRDYDLMDVVADSAGCIAGLVYSLVVYRKPNS